MSKKSIVTNVRSISKKGSLTVPINIRRSLGLEDKTPIEFSRVGKDGGLFVMKAKKHCICCGSTVVPLKPVGKVFICEDCLAEANEAPEEPTEHAVLEDVIDQCVSYENRIIELKEKQDALKTRIQDEGVYLLNETNKTVSMEGHNSKVDLQVAHTVKEPTKEAYEYLRSFMNQYTRDNDLLAMNTVKYSMSSDFKRAAIILSTERYSVGDFDESIQSVCKDAGVEDSADTIIANWTGDSKKDAAVIRKCVPNFSGGVWKLEYLYNWKFVKQLFPKASEAELQRFADCFVVTDSVKLAFKDK